MAALTSKSILHVSLAVGAGLVLAARSLAADLTVRLDAGSGFSIRNSSGAIERLRVEEATGNVSRNGALFVHTTGANNLFVGLGAGNLGTTGFGRNVAIGVAALSSNTTGNLNSAAGFNALLSNAGGFTNSAFGARTLAANTSGYSNSAFGAYALQGNTTGDANTAVGVGALVSNGTANFNSAVGVDALSNNSTGSWNSAFGAAVLLSNSTGQSNSAVGADALRLNSIGNRNSAVGRRALGSNTIGSFNNAVGYRALYANTTASRNSAFGEEALRSNTTGGRNSAFGMWALRSSTTSGSNSAFGYASLNDNQTGYGNTALGAHALYDNVSGYSNVAVGRFALFSTTGSRNVGLGFRAGVYVGSGNDNIHVSNEGSSTDDRQIRIGTVGTQTHASMAGIHGNTSALGTAVLVNASGALGTTTSSARFKEDVRDMGDASDVLMELRPVTFRYRVDAVGADAANTPQYGLIAEEVAEVAPELVTPDLEGRPYSVKYHVLPALLLAQNQEQERTIEAQRHAIAALEARFAQLESRRIPVR
jgi:hypothetical protein